MAVSSHNAGGKKRKERGEGTTIFGVGRLPLFPGGGGKEGGREDGFEIVFTLRRVKKNGKYGDSFSTFRQGVPSTSLQGECRGRESSPTPSGSILLA